MDFRKLRNYLVAILLIGVTGAFIWMLKFFVYPLFWAAVIAALFYPVYKRINGFFRHPNLSSLISIIIVTLIIIIPLTIVGLLLLKETTTFYNEVRDAQGSISQTIQSLNAFVKNNPLTAQFHIDDAYITQKISEGSGFVLNVLLDNLKTWTQNSLEFVAMFILMLYTLFFFLRDGERIIKKIMYLSPLRTKQELSLYHKFTATASSTIRGTIFIGGIQGLLCGIALAVAGVDSAVIWGIVTVFASVIPGFGSSIVWVPAALFLLLAGDIWQAIFVAAFGTFIISTIDNLLRPVLVGKDIQMHPLIILFSTLGGIAAFGISGFLIGPIIAALFLAFWEMYEEYYTKDLEKLQQP